MAAACNCLAPSHEGPGHISAQPILMHVFRNKLASLLKSLLWPMNIWCGQGWAVEGYNDRVLSYLARQRGSVPSLTQNTPPLCWDLEEPNPQEVDTMTTLFFFLLLHLSTPLKWENLRFPLLLDENQIESRKPSFFFPCDWEIIQWAFNRFNGPRSDTTQPGRLNTMNTGNTWYIKTWTQRDRHAERKAALALHLLRNAEMWSRRGSHRSGINVRRDVKCYFSLR